MSWKLFFVVVYVVNDKQLYFLQLVLNFRSLFFLLWDQEPKCGETKIQSEQVWSQNSLIGTCNEKWYDAMVWIEEPSIAIHKQLLCILNQDEGWPCLVLNFDLLTTSTLGSSSHSYTERHYIFNRTRARLE